MPGLRKGTPSRRGRVAEIVLDLTRVNGMAASLEEVASEWARRFPDDANGPLANVIAGLVTSGVLRCVFGRPPHGRYAHRDFVIDVVPANEPMAAAVAAVETLFRKRAEGAPTIEVTRLMRHMGVDLPDPRNYRLLLDALTRPSSRGAPTWRAPKLVSGAVRGRDGRLRTLWWPAGLEVRTAERLGARAAEVLASSRGAVPTSAVEAAMEAVVCVESVLGQPVSRADLTLWMGTHSASDPVAQYLEERACLGSGLEQLGERRVARLVHGKGDWRIVRTDYTVPGGPPERYSMRAVGGADEGDVSTPDASVTLEDRLMTFVPADEAESLDAAWRLVHPLASPPLEEIMLMRERLLSARARPAAAEHRLSEAVATLARATATRIDWCSRFHVNARSAKIAPFAAIERHLAALPRIAPCTATEKTGLNGVRIVGAAATASHSDLAPYAANVSLLLTGVPANEAQVRAVYQRARRVPNPDARWEKNATDGSLIPLDRMGLGWLRVDRVDALTLIMDAVAPARATALLLPARVLLGHVLRDAKVLGAAFEAVPLSRRDVRRSLMLALALLGEPVPYEAAVARPSDEQDTAAHLLAQVLCDPSPDRLSRVAINVLRHATSAEARRVASEADRMIGSGILLSVVG